MIAVSLLTVVLAGGSPLPDPSPDDATAEREFASLVETMHSISVDPDPGGGLRVTPLWSIPRPQDLFCGQDDAATRRLVEFGVASTCAARDDPPFDERSVVRKAAESVQRWIGEELGIEDFPVEREGMARLQRRADERFRVLLRESKLVERLVEARRRHLEGPSSCRDEFLALADVQRRGFLQTEGACAGAWDEAVEVCTSPRLELAAHIAFHPPKSVGQERRRTLEALARAGLSDCLAALIERSDDDGLAETVRALTLATERAVLSDARRRAWTVWRAAGVETWLDRTAAAGGSIPADVAAALEA